MLIDDTLSLGCESNTEAPRKDLVMERRKGAWRLTLAAAPGRDLVKGGKTSSPSVVSMATFMVGPSVTKPSTSVKMAVSHPLSSASICTEARVAGIFIGTHPKLATFLFGPHPTNDRERKRQPGV